MSVLTKLSVTSAALAGDAAGVSEGGWKVGGGSASAGALTMIGLRLGSSAGAGGDTVTDRGAAGRTAPGAAEATLALPGTTSADECVVSALAGAKPSFTHCDICSQAVSPKAAERTTP